MFVALSMRLMFTMFNVYKIRYRTGLSKKMYWGQHSTVVSILALRPSCLKFELWLWSFVLKKILDAAKLKDCSKLLRVRVNRAKSLLVD